MGYLQSWAAANPDSARVLLAAVVFAVMYATRKLLPGVWTFFETRSPWLGEEMKFLDQLLHKLWQAVPSALTGALLGPALFGDGWKQALIGALNGLAAPLSHELMARYRGQLRSPKTPGGPDVQSGDSKEARDQTDVATPPDAVMLQRRRRSHYLFGLAFTVLLLQGCALLNRQTAKTVVDIAHDLCVAHFSKEKPALSLEDIARTYCKDLDPWVDSVLGAERLGASKAAAKAKAAAP